MEYKGPWEFRRHLSAADSYTRGAQGNDSRQESGGCQSSDSTRADKGELSGEEEYSSRNTREQAKREIGITDSGGEIAQEDERGQQNKTRRVIIVLDSGGENTRSAKIMLMEGETKCVTYEIDHVMYADSTAAPGTKLGEIKGRLEIYEAKAAEH